MAILKRLFRTKIVYYDVAGKVASENYQKKVWFFGIKLLDHDYDRVERIEEVKGRDIGFGKK